MSNAATVAVVNGPWQVWHPDGVRVVIELPATADPSELAKLLHLRRSDAGSDVWLRAPVDVPVQLAAVNRGLHRKSQVAWWELRGDDALPGRISIQTHYDPDLSDPSEQALGVVELGPRLDRQEAVLVAVASTFNYPDAAQLAGIEAAAGRPVDAVVLLGSHVGLRVGTGGWERRLPLIWFPADDISDDERVMLGTERLWPMGLRIGPVGLLTAADIRHANTIIGRDLSPWQIWCEPDASWDLGLVGEGVDRRRDVESLRLLLAAVMRRQLPLILGASHSTAFISDPLVVAVDFDQRFGQLALSQSRITTANLRLARRRMQETGKGMKEVLVGEGMIAADQANRIEEEVRAILADELRTGGEESGVVVQPGGARYVAISAAGGSFATVPEAVALPIYQRGCFAIMADKDRLDLLFCSAATPAQTWRAAYDQPDAGRLLPGWGKLEAAVTAWLAGDDLPEGLQASDLVWATAATFLDAAETPSKTVALLDRVAGGDAPPGLLRRAMVVDRQVAGAWLHRDNTRVPVVVERDWFLRLLDQPDGMNGRELTDYMRNCTDPHALAAIINLAERGDDQTRSYVLNVLLQRLRQQCAGQLPFDRDPLIQHAIFSHCFHSPLLSADGPEDCFKPALAVATPLSRQVLVRYLAERARPTMIVGLAESSDDPAVIAALLAMVHEYPTATNNAAMRNASRRRLYRQVAGQEPWLPTATQQGIVDLVLSDHRLSEDRRQELIDLLRSRRDLQLPARPEGK